MTDPRKPIFDAVRAAAPAGLFNDRGNILALDNLLDAFSVPRPGQAARPAPRLSSAPLSSPEPRWMSEARARIGEREIPGPRHNSWIAQSWGRLGARWFNDDETPWCGLFVAHCLDWAGFQIPPASQFPRALAWNDWGKPCHKAIGAIVVFRREGGGHVGFLVGESAANYYVLGGNQSNMVNITPIAKARAVGIRWPKSLELPREGLPPMSGGTVSRNEA